jgi:hypothetical protein
MPSQAIIEVELQDRSPAGNQTSGGDDDLVCFEGAAPQPHHGTFNSTGAEAPLHMLICWKGLDLVGGVMDKD